MKKEKILIISAWCFSLFGMNNLCGFEKIPTDKLLAEYLKNDNSIKNLTIAVQKEILSQNKAEIDNGFNIELSTGEMNLSFSDDGISFSVNPSVTATVPDLNNLKVNVSAKMDNKDIISTSTLSLSADILSSVANKNEIQSLKSNRKILEAKRNLQKKALSVEKTFYAELSNLLKSTKSVVTLEQSLYTDKQDFELIKAKGYSTNSSDYKLSEMKVLSDLHEIESKKHSLIHDYVMFYKKCGFNIQLEMTMDFIELIPSDIAEVQILNIQDFSQNQFSEIEAAEWEHKINSMEREAQRDYSLAAEAGFTYKNQSTKTNSIDAGIRGDFKGIAATAGVSFPVGSDKKSPALSLKATVNPNSFKKEKIDDYVQELTEEQELLNIESAYTNYENQVVAYSQKIEDLQWEKTTNIENLEMYERLEKELKNWFDQGIISETKYLSAKTQVQLYRVQQEINKIDFIVYNNEIKSLFVEQRIL